MRQRGVVVGLPIYDREKKDYRRDESGRVKMFPHVRTLDGKRFRIYRDEIQTVGLDALRYGQVAEFDADRFVARDIVRVPAYEHRLWRDAAHAIDTQNGHSGWVAGTVESSNPRNRTGVVAVGGERVLLARETRVLRRDPEDLAGYREGDDVYVKVEGGVASAAICLED
jgi:hypothetical protein